MSQEILSPVPLADTDGDGISDGSDPQPRQGVTLAHGDRVGSTVLVTKADGTALERVTYKPFGGAVDPNTRPRSSGSRASASSRRSGSTTTGRDSTTQAWGGSSRRTRRSQIRTTPTA